MAAPVVQLILGKVLEDFYRSTTVLPCLLAVAGGILLLTARGKQAGYTVGGLLAILGSSVVISHMLLLPAMLLWGLSAIGVSWNKPVSRLLKGRSLPVLNLAAAILAAVSALLCLDTVGSMPAFALPLGTGRCGHGFAVHSGRRADVSAPFPGTACPAGTPRTLPLRSPSRHAGELWALCSFSSVRSGS